MFAKKRIKKNFRKLNNSMETLTKNLLHQFLVNKRDLVIRLKSLCESEDHTYGLICLDCSIFANNLGFDVIAFDIVAEFMEFCDKLPDTEECIYDFLRYHKENPDSTLSLFHEYRNLITFSRQYKKLAKISTSIHEVENIK